MGGQLSTERRTIAAAAKVAAAAASVAFTVLWLPAPFGFMGMRYVG